MPLSLKPPPLASAVRGSVAYAARAREQLQAGLSDARVASLRPPDAGEHFRRFVYGFSLPITMMRVGWSNAETRSSMRRRLLPPVLLVAVVATLGVYNIARTVVTARHDPTVLAREVEHDDDDDDDKDEGKKARKKAKEEAVEKAVVRAAAGAKEKGGGVAAIGEAAVAAAREEAESAEAPDPPRPTGFAAAAHAVFDFLTSKVAKLIVTLSVIEWLLVWVGREHHDQIAFETATLTGVPGEALAGPPRLRLDMAWLKLKGWRAVRLLLFLALIAPVAWLVGSVPHVGSYLAVAVEAAWAAYWACVFAIANTFLVWDDPPSGAAPWFIRVLARAGRVPLLGVPVWLYSRVLRFATWRVWPACVAFEQAAWESAGMALARGIASVPGVYIITRPAFTTAATHALLARSATPSRPQDGFQNTNGTTVSPPNTLNDRVDEK